MRHDDGMIEYTEHPDVTWLGAYEDQTLVGIFILIRDCVDVDIHVAILKPWIRHARAFGRLCLQYVFTDPAIHRATAWILDLLPSVRNYALRMGFTLEGYRRNCVRVGGKLTGAYMLGMTREEWQHG